MNMEKIIIHESIKEGTPSQNCSLCENWGAEIETRNGKRKAHGHTRKDGKVFKECSVLHHIAIESCICQFYSER